MKGRIQGIKAHSLKFLYCFGIHLAHMVLAHTDNLNQTLQGTQMTAIDAQVISRACVTTLQLLLSEDEFKLFWAKVKQFATAHNVKAAIAKSYDEEFATVTTFYRDDINIDLLSVQLKTLPAVICSSDELVNTFYDVRNLVKEL